MPRNRAQHQKGLSDDAFERLYPDEQACRKAWFAWRWPEGFKCPRCAASEYCEIRGRQLLQCRQCPPRVGEDGDRADAMRRRGLVAQTASPLWAMALC